MHELYLAEQVINEVIKRSQDNKAEEILETTIVVPHDEHFTAKEFETILKNQSVDTMAEKTKFKVLTENTQKIYIKDIKVV